MKQKHIAVTIILLIGIMCVALIGCSMINGDKNPQHATVEITGQTIQHLTGQTIQRLPQIASFGDEKVIYIDENQVATIISKSGDVLHRTDLRTVKPIETSYEWKTSIPHNNKDTLYAEAKFIDDVIYYSYYVKNGKTYGVDPYLGLFVKLVDLPCQSGWIRDIDAKKHLSCNGKVHASLAIWKEVARPYQFNTTSTRAY